MNWSRLLREHVELCMRLFTELSTNLKLRSSSIMRTTSLIFTSLNSNTLNSNVKWGIPEREVVQDLLAVVVPAHTREVVAAHVHVAVLAHRLSLSPTTNP
jgi:hypothetical protein